MRMSRRPRLRQICITHPARDEAGTYSFTHLASGTYTVRQVVPATLSATTETERSHIATISAAVGQTGVDFADVYRANEIHGVKFDDANGNHIRDAGEAGVAGATIYVDLDRDNIEDPGEPRAVTAADGSYAFTNLAPGAYVVRQVATLGYTPTSPNTVGGILWPTGVSNPAVGNVNPTSITTSLATGVSYRQTVSLTLPNTGALTNLVDVFLLFDDTGSFVNNSPIVRAAFPDIISQLQTSLPGIDLGFGVGRLEEYANFASEYATGRPFILNQPIVAASSAGYLASIQAALNRTTPGYGGDQPETDIEALYQLVTGRGFDGNNNGSVLDSGAAGLAATQLNPGSSGDVPSFASFVADPANNVLPAAGNVGGAGFRAGALPIILLATDTGFAYQPQGETSVVGLGGVTVPVSALTQTSRPTTPFDSGAGLQQTITGLNALGALVIGLGTNPQATLDPRQGLEAISKLTGATNQSTATIANGTADPIAPGDPLYFQITSGFGASVANGVTSAIQNAVTNVAVDIELQASDPRVHLINHTGTLHNIGAGSSATFDVEFVGDGIPHRFDLQFVRAGTNVVLGSIPVVLGTPIPGDCYEFDDLQAGEIEVEDNFGSRLNAVAVNPIWQGVAGANWSATGNWSGSVPNSTSAVAKFTTTGGALAYLDIDQTVNNLTFDATTSNDYTISGPGKLTLTGTAPALSTTAANTGDQTIAVNLDLAAGTTIIVNGGSLSLNVPATNAVLGAGVTATVAVGATLNLGGTGNALSNDTTTHADVTNNGTLTATIAGKRAGNITGTGTTNVNTAGAALTVNSIRQASLTIGVGNTVTVAANGTDTGVSRVTDLSINATGKLDLNNNDLIVDNGNLAALTALVRSGMNLNGSIGNGPGIASTAAGANPNLTTSLGIAPNSELGYTSFGGLAVDPNDVLIKYSYFGDSDLNGVVDTSTDFDLYITGLTSGGSLGGWLYGDFDHNGIVDSSTDFDLFITGLTGQTGSLLTSTVFNVSPIQASSESAFAISTLTSNESSVQSGASSAALSNQGSTADPLNSSATVYALNSSAAKVSLSLPSGKLEKSEHRAPPASLSPMEKAKREIRSSIFAELGQPSFEKTQSTVTKRKIDVESENDLWNEPFCAPKTRAL